MDFSERTIFVFAVAAALLLLLLKRSSKEMDFSERIAATAGRLSILWTKLIEVVAPIMEKYRDREARCRLLREASDPLERLAQTDAHIEIMEIFFDARKVCAHVYEIGALYEKMEDFEEFYPAATKLRTSLGDGIWTSLENYRAVVTYLAFSTLRGKTTAWNELPTELKAFLNENTAHMKTYIRARYGEHTFISFQDILNFLLEVNEGGRHQGIGDRHGWPMKFLLSKFRRQPIFWLMYNLNFPVEGRMSWAQLSMWAIQRLRKRDDIEPPTWPIELRGLEAWNRDATGMWNEAVIEVFTDIRRRFCAIERLHFTV